jgi:hypothetical protein
MNTLFDQDLALVSSAARRLIVALQAELQRQYDLIVMLEGRMDAHLREQHPETADKLSPLMRFQEWIDGDGVRHIDVSSLGAPIGAITIATVNGGVITVPVYDPGPDEPMLTAMAKYKQRAALVAAADKPIETLNGTEGV